jgi:hypothetical protein
MYLTGREVIHCDSPYKLYEDTQWISYREGCTAVTRGANICWPKTAQVDNSPIPPSGNSEFRIQNSEFRAKSVSQGGALCYPTPSILATYPLNYTGNSDISLSREQGWVKRLRRLSGEASGGRLPYKRRLNGV